MDEPSAINAQQLRDYLASTGWTTTRVDAAKDIWTLGEVDHILLPQHRLADYEMLIEQALRRLAAVEHRPLDDVLVDLEWPSHDKLVARTRADRPSPAVPLQDALSLNGALRDLVVASARAAERPQPSYRGGWSNAVGNYIDHVRMLPSRPGSYSLRALLPLNAAEPDEQLLPTAPTTSIRAVTRTLLIAAEAAREAAQARAAGASDQVFEDAVERGVSADLLDALVRLGGPEEDPAPVELSVTWTYAAPEEDLPPVVVPDGLLPTLAHGADVLRGSPDPVRATVTGLVVRLHRENKLGPGEITVHGFIESAAGSSTRLVRMELDERTYEEAVNAHRDGAAVRVACTIMFGGTRLEVTEVARFDVTSAD